MTNQELFNLANSLSTLNIEGVKVNYAIVKNINLIKQEFEIFEDVIKPSDKYKEYDNKRIDLAIKYAHKNEDGTPVVHNNQIQINDIASFQREHADLIEIYSSEIANRNKQLEEYTKILAEENDSIKLCTVTLNSIPENISTKDMHILYPILSDT